MDDDATSRRSRGRGGSRTAEPSRRISNQISRIQATYYGKGPLRAKTYIIDNLVVCVLEETFTRAEKTLIDRGDREAIQEFAGTSRTPCARRVIRVVEQVTGGVSGPSSATLTSSTTLGRDVPPAEERTSMEASRHRPGRSTDVLAHDGGPGGGHHSALLLFDHLSSPSR
jgi:uncharacterized protein YbcI